MWKSLWLRISLIAVAVIGVDQATKSWAVSALSDNNVHLAGPFRLTLVYNPGIAFGIGSGFAPYLVVIAIGVIVIAMIKQRAVLRGGAIAAVGLVLGGALGNLIDRLFRGHGGAVVDFFDVGPWPVFNVADAAVVVGALALAVAGARAPTPREEETA